MRFEDWKAVMEHKLQTAQVFAIHCWHGEPEALELALQYGGKQKSNWEYGEILAGRVTPAFCQMLLSQSKPSDHEMGERNTPFFTIALDNGFWSEHYGTELNDVKKTVLCYGDSNTYGYDPRGFFGGRYDPENRWCDILAKKTGWQVVNCGENGRTLPQHSWAYEDLENAILKYAPVPLMTIMLGTNDILMGYAAEVAQVAQSMEKLLERLEHRFPETTVLLIAPPSVRVGVPKLEEQMKQLSGFYREMAQKRHLYFCDAGAWELPLAHDGVHLSEEGHRIFAQKLLDFFSQENIAL